MHDFIFYAAVLWQLALFAALAVYGITARSTVIRALAIDTVALIMVATLALVALYRGEGGYLDVALALAMLAFAQTVATVRLVERRRGLR